MSYSIGSLFDGSGGFPLAGTLCGMDPRWASEVEPYPIAVTRSRFPNMKHLGDISKINGAGIEPVDIITFGSPCQGLSVAGRQKGLEDERSVLFIEAVRIIKEMSEATNGKYPTFALWENVPGAFSSNKGEDFRTVLEELAKITEPDAVMPSVPKRGWAYADSYVGDGWSLAYRVLNAQHIRTAQRRRRVYLVLDLRGQRARKVLFEREGVRWHPEADGAQGQSATVGAQGSLRADGQRVTAYDVSTARRALVSPTLDTVDPNPNKNQGGLAIVYSIDQGGGKSSCSIQEEKAPTLTCTHGGEPAVVYDYKVRRVTPTECARLQGFPDEWGVIDKKNTFTEEELSFWKEVRNTHAAINGRRVRGYTEKQMLAWYNKLHSDSAEYKMWGNGIALPPALYCMQGMAEALNEEEDRPTKCKR